MKLRDGTNTISDELFDAAAVEMYARHGDEYEVVHNGSGRSEEFPRELSARHNREWEQLERDRDVLGVQQWLKKYPEHNLEQLERQAIEQRYDGSIWGSAEHAERRAEETLHHTAVRGWRGLATSENVQNAAVSLAAARPSHTFTEGRMAESPRDQMRSYYHARAVNAGFVQPQRQSELFRQEEAQRNTQQEQQGQTQTQRLRPTLVQ